LFSGVIAVLLLLPIPAFATLTLGTWTSSGDPGWTTTSSGTTLVISMPASGTTSSNEVITFSAPVTSPTPLDYNTIQAQAFVNPIHITSGSGVTTSVQITYTNLTTALIGSNQFTATPGNLSDFTATNLPSVSVTNAASLQVIFTFSGVNSYSFTAGTDDGSPHFVFTGLTH
jgi:hypothetical protein